jgi:hypothetical protein
VPAYAGTQGATGHLEVTVSLRNVSGRPCTVRGYPGARLLDASGHPLAIRVRDGGGFFPDSQSKPRQVKLVPGSRAVYGVSFVTNNEYAGARRCATAATLMSLAPGASEWKRVSLRGHPRVTPCGDAIVLSPVYAL